MPMKIQDGRLIIDIDLSGPEGALNKAIDSYLGTPNKQVVGMVGYINAPSSPIAQMISQAFNVWVGTPEAKGLFQSRIRDLIASADGQQIINDLVKQAFQKAMQRHAGAVVASFVASGEAKAALDAEMRRMAVAIISKG